TGTKVIGVDVCRAEVNQAKRVFKKDNLQFIAGRFNSGMFARGNFNIILFAASIQYFSSLRDILQIALKCLAKEGEIHVMDTHFYKPNEIEGAKQRTKNYYSILGYPEMEAHYFHHHLKDIRQFNHKILVNPKNIFNKISKKEIFYWISIIH